MGGVRRTMVPTPLAGLAESEKRLWADSRGLFPIAHLVAVYWRKALALLCLICLLPSWAVALERQKFPPGSPEEAVESILYGDYMILDRDAPDRVDPKLGGKKHFPLDGLAFRPNDRYPWNACTVSAYIRNYRIVGVTPALVEGIPERRIDPDRAFVTVQMEVVGLWLWEEGHRTRSLQRCGWLGLKIHDGQAGKDDYYFDQLDDPESFITQVKSFGTLVGEARYTSKTNEYLRVPKHRRQWEFGIGMYRDHQGIWRPEFPYFPPHTSLHEAIKALERNIRDHQETLNGCHDYLADSWCARNIGKPDPALEWIKPLLELNKN